MAIPPAPMMPSAAAPGPTPTPGQPPIGSSPATGPTPNAGAMVKGNQIIGAALKLLAMGVSLVGPGSPLGQKVLKALQDIGKDLPPGAATESGEKNAMQEMMMKQQSQGPAMAAMRQQAAAPPPPTATPPPMAA